jgi:hypothetical protein
MVQKALNQTGAERPPICPTCGVTMVPGALSADPEHADDWICLECEETGEHD